MRRNDAAPIGNTCPLIDEIINEIHGWYKDSEEISRASYDSFEEKMEKLRQANTTLREWGNDEYKRAEELEKDLDKANDEVRDLKNEVSELNDAISDLYKELDKVS